MAQYAVPDVDVVDGTWEDQASGTDLHTAIVPGTPGSIGAPDDATYIESAANPTTDTCEMDLTTIEDPVSSAGHTLRWRRYKDAAGGGTIGLTLNLREASTGGNGTVRVTHVDADISETVATTTEVLTGGEADSITDYADLQIEFIADQT
jgi:hypothetical protein